MDKRILVLAVLVLGGLAWLVLQPGDPETAADPPSVGPNAEVAEAMATESRTTSRSTVPNPTESSPEATPQTAGTEPQAPVAKTPAPAPVPTLAEARAAAESGDTSLYEEIARRGSGTEKKNAALALVDLAEKSGDQAKAIEWRKLAAEAGDADSMVLLAHAYQAGKGVAADPGESVKYFVMAQNAGRSEGVDAVEEFRGEANSDYIGGNYKAALERFIPLAEGGDTSVMYTLGTMYQQGQGTAASPAQARRWFQTSAAEGDARSMNQLASMYATGAGVARDDKRAVELWRKAADAGDVNAMINLAQMYELGLGVPKDSQQANAWNKKATEAGNRAAAEKLKRLQN